MKEKFSLVLFVTLVLLTFAVGSTCTFSSVQVGKEKLERIENPYPYKSGSTDLLSSTGVSVGLSNGTPSDHLQFADVNGDGLADALYFDTLSSNKVYVALSNGIDSFGTPTQWWQHGGSTPDMIQYADIDGDNNADAIYFDTFRTMGVWVGLSNGIDGFNKPGSGMWWQHGGSTPDMIQYADVDGDNNADAIYFDTFRTMGVLVGLSNGIDGFSKPGSGMWWQHGVSTPGMIQYADVNGDNNADAIYFDTIRSKGVWVGLSNGVNGFNASGSGEWGHFDL